MEKKQYTKLSELVDSAFTVTKAWGYQFKLWDNESKEIFSDIVCYSQAKKYQHYVSPNNTIAIEKAKETIDKISPDSYHELKMREE
jgi:hypothetical protein